MIPPGGEEFTGSTAVRCSESFQKTQLTVQKWPLATGLTANQGLLLFTNSDFTPDTDNHGGATQEIEALIFTRNP